ncbi:PASTA domain-containing protein (plasmid) [Streptomyces sp. BI20]|uniref:PASTA domain-containing protein n=1 Tax=Streptomyces sp. BI20 TaxID=3403460 RepID=UPI003C7611BA
MRTHTITVGIAALGMLALTGCTAADTAADVPTRSSASTPASVPTPSSDPDDAAAAPAPAAPEAAADKATVPNAVGQVLQTAQDQAQAGGFFLLGSTDALGRGRMQVLDRNWKVCAQTPAAGTAVDTTTKLVFATVKLEESCP